MIIGQNGYVGSVLNTIKKQDAIILMAAHSSIKMCENDPAGAWVNNVDFFRAVLNDIKDEKFIYASSATVYDGVDNPTEETTDFKTKHLYDLTKRTIDELAKLSGKKFYGLRFATVNGWSPVLRVDVMLNKMAYDAQTTGKINVKNGHLNRPILGIQDCKRAVRHIIDNDLEPGIYNLASFSAPIQEMAEYVAREFGAEVVEEESDIFDRPYAYGIDTSKFRNTGFEFKETLESVVESLKKKPERVKVCV